MNLARRIRLAFAVLMVAPLLAACTFTGDIEVTEQSQFEVDLLVKDSTDVCDQDFAQSVLEGLTIEQLDEIGECRISGTAGAGLAAVLGVTLSHDESGYRLSTSPGMSWWNPNTVDLTVRFPGPITEVVGAEQVGPSEVRVAYNGYEDIPAITIASRSGFGPSTVEWAAVIGLVTGVALTLLVVGLRKARRHRLVSAQLAGWPPPDSLAGGPAIPPGEMDPAEEAFWSGASEARPPVIGERTKRPGSDPSVWAPPPG